MIDALKETVHIIKQGGCNTALAKIYRESHVSEEQKRWGEFLEVVLADSVLRSLITNNANESTPPRLFRAPGRSEIGGNHTDHNHGLAIVGTLTTDMIAVVQQRNDQIIRIHNTDNKQTDEVNCAASLATVATEQGSSTALIRGVAAGLQRHGVSLHGFNAITTSAIAVGGGLSSSAAFEMLVATVLHCLAEQTPSLSMIDVAKIGQYAENEYFGKPCGLEDQIGVVNGGITQIDFGNFDAIELKQIHVDFSNYGLQLAIVDSQEDHAGLTDHYAAIPAEMRAIASSYGETVLRAVSRERVVRDAPRLRALHGDRAVLRALHFFRECERVQAKISALQHDDIETFIRLVHASGESSWMWLQNCIVPHVGKGHAAQAMAFALAMTSEFIADKGATKRAACRVHGGGFAGAIQLYLPIELTEEYAQYANEYIGSDCYFPLWISPCGVTEIIQEA